MINNIKGTKDIGFNETYIWQFIESFIHDYLKKYGYSLDSDQIMPISPSGFKLYIWALFDRVNLILFSINEYGLCRGIQKVVKAYRERIK